MPRLKSNTPSHSLFFKTKQFHQNEITEEMIVHLQKRILTIKEKEKKFKENEDLQELIELVRPFKELIILKDLRAFRQAFENIDRDIKKCEEEISLANGRQTLLESLILFKKFYEINSYCNRLFLTYNEEMRKNLEIIDDISCTWIEYNLAAELATQQDYIYNTLHTYLPQIGYNICPQEDLNLKNVIFQMKNIRSVIKKMPDSNTSQELNTSILLDQIIELFYYLTRIYVRNEQFANSLNEYLVEHAEHIDFIKGPMQKKFDDASLYLNNILTQIGQRLAPDEKYEDVIHELLYGEEDNEDNKEEERALAVWLQNLIYPHVQKARQEASRLRARP